MRTFDYVVVGGGSAGCIAAAELARTGATVLMLEAGDASETHPETLSADGYKDAFINDALMHERMSVPQDYCGGLQKFMGSGRVVGGSGGINGMVYTRGAKEDYAEWPEGWRWDDVVPAFDALEDRIRPRPRPATAWTTAALTAATQAGFRRSDNLNDGDLSGVMGYEHMNYDGDRRRNSYVAFIQEDPPRTLTMETGALVERLVLSQQKGTPRVDRVEYQRDGKQLAVHVAREVVMAAGALETPKLLMLSGIGPADVLRSQGISVGVEVPELGRNLHDHPNVALFFLGRNEVDCNYPQLYGFHRANALNGLPSWQSDTCYVMYPARSSLVQASQRMLPTFMPPALRHNGTIRTGMRAGLRSVFSLPPAQWVLNRLYGIVVILGKPHSRGKVTLASARPQDQALLDPAYFADPRDMETMYQGVRQARRIAMAPALREWGNQELAPGPWRDRRDAIVSWIGRAAMTTYHYAGTCRMGRDRQAVVTPELALNGVANIRIADASAVPTTPVSAMNAPSMLVGYRAAQFAAQQQERRASA